MEPPARIAPAFRPPSTWLVRTAAAGPDVGLRRGTASRQATAMIERTRAPRRSMSLGVLGAVAFIALSAVPVAAAGFPAKDARYHDYPEMVAEIKATEAAHPEIVDVFSIGKSYQGRDIWAAKISDNVADDEAEPEVMFDALHHAREHMTVEQALYLLRLLAGNYGTDDQITKLVDTREIWIIFAVNPDGFVYDLTCTGSSHPPYCAWRKNRQPNAGTSAVGTDINRNYGYRFACCGGSSGSPSSITYRGSKAFSAPETRALRDFVLGRVVGGVQQIRAHITFHTNGQLVLWPYGYTTANVPSDMTTLDHSTFVALGRAMAARNGYKAEQSSDLYITDGDQIDWMYGAQRIFSFTWELYPPETSTVWGDHYPADENIATQTARNRTALIYLITAAGCPYGAVNQAKANCGPLYDDFEIARGWTTNPDGTDTATTGRLMRGDPSPTTTSNGLRIQPNLAYSGRYGFFTGLAAGASLNSYDLDGRSTIRSRPIQLADPSGVISFRYTFAHGPSSSADTLKLLLENEAGERTEVWSVAGTAATVGATWRGVTVAPTAFAGQTVRLVFQATDGGTNSLVEIGIDDVRVERAS
jgi:carboxypeptidase T